MSDKTVVLTSGGIDSSVCLAMAAEEYSRVIPVHYNYGQQTAELERIRAYRQCEHIANTKGVSMPKTPVIDYEPVFSNFAEGVAGDRDSFVTDDGSLEEDDGRSTGYVPMRNLHLIATGAAIADVKDADSVWHGAQGGDEESYPDCRPSFMNAAQEAVSQSVPQGQEILVRTPLIDLSKSEVIQKGENLGVKWEYTYSCYTEVDDLTDPDPCGECPACVERIEAFEEAGVVDPTME